MGEFLISVPGNFISTFFSNDFKSQGVWKVGLMASLWRDWRYVGP